MGSAVSAVGTYTEFIKKSILRNMKLLLLLCMLIFSIQGAPQDPDDYFGQEEADYDYYYDGDTDLTMDDEPSMNTLSFNVGYLRSHRRKGEDEDKKHHRDVSTSERLIQEIDARGSNITIHDSRIDNLDARGGTLNVRTNDNVYINGGVDSEHPVETADELATEPVPVAEPLEAPLPIEDLVIELEEPEISEDESEPEEDVISEDITEPEEAEIIEHDGGDPEHPIINGDGLDFDYTFMEKLQGLQFGMESVVTILKEIAGKVGCANGGIVERSTHPCPPPFELVGSTDCLFLGQANKVTWASARQICSSLGADLVHPKQEGQVMDFILGITDHHRAPTETVWVGASDRRQEGVWTWVNGQVAPSDLPWAPGHPKSFNGREDCMAMHFTEPLGLQASNCMRKKPFICQKEYVKK